MKAFPGTVLAAAVGCAFLVMQSAALARPVPDPERNALAGRALENFYNLEYDQAIALFEQLRDSDQRNPVWQNRVALAYFYKQLYTAGVLQGDLFSASNKFFRMKKVQTDPKLMGNFRQANQTALRLCEQRLKQNDKDEEALYACGVAYASRATEQGLIERSKVDFMGSAHKAYEYHSRLVRRNPRYYDAYLITGIYDFVLGSLPGPLKFLLLFVGLTGNKERGVHAVEGVAQWGDQAKADAKIMLAVMYRREKRYADARRVLHDLAGAYPKNFLLPLEIASVHRAAGEIDAAIKLYEQVLADVRQGTAGYQEAPVARIHYELGALYRQAGNLESARMHFSQVAGSRGSMPELEQQSSLLQQAIEQALRQQKAEPAAPSAGQALAP
ncbi:MAG: hypothetical protein A3J28_12595 [Acidobacteria bacterium RIFCSPLOWO2_12_FULL_60_22]|nr:MAG: hypothetical protein A3J28_12595 [Acidobacteria bacterium RIFCSPLOWO2_12_FULL_60_22]